MRRTVVILTVIAAGLISWPTSRAAGSSGGYVMVDIATLGRSSRAVAINDAGQVVGSYTNARGDHRAFLYDGTLHRLGTLGGRSSVAVDINEAGQVAGTSKTPDGSRHAFLWDGQMYDLGTLGGSESYAVDINEAGQVAGSSRAQDGVDHAFFWDGQMHDLGTLQARALNDAGQVVGSFEFSDNPITFHAFFWDGQMHDLEAGYSWASDINELGQVVGAGNYQAFLWDGELHDLGTPAGYEESGACCINDAGQVAGTFVMCDPVCSYHAFLWDGWDGEFHDFGAGYAYAMNESGEVVGRSYTAKGNSRAFLYDGTLHRLGTLGGRSSWAVDINAAGQTVGTSTDAAGHPRAFLASPER